MVMFGRWGVEGLVSKHRESSYRGGRFDRWVKVKNRQHPAFSRVSGSVQLSAVARIRNDLNRLA